MTTPTHLAALPHVHSHIHPHIASAMRTLRIEADAVLGLEAQLGDAFIKAVDLFCVTAKAGGRVVVMGMGKSGQIARKIAATLSSTGTPALFVHPAEAAHGDLGMVTERDVVLALSNSGESDELGAILPHLKRMQIPVVAMTSNAVSSLAKYGTLVLLTRIDKEACPLNLAPTASTTAQLAMGDALAIACLEHSGFAAQDFAASHPGGALGRRLLTKVSGVMRMGTTAEPLPIITPEEGTSMGFEGMMRLMSRSGLGLAISVDLQGKPTGVFTDGDLRRELMAGTNLIGTAPLSLFRSVPKTIAADALAVDAAAQMEEHRITSLVVVDSAGKLVGALNTNDLLRAKVI